MPSSRVAGSVDDAMRGDRVAGAEPTSLLRIWASLLDINPTQWLPMIVPTETPTLTPTWSAETRTLVSLLLFAHLFAVVVAVTAYTQPSALQLRLHRLFSPYLRNLHLTALPNSYPFARFHLTHANTTDVDFSIEIEAHRADGASEVVGLPPTPLQPLVRFRRYQALANATGSLATGEMGDAVVSILPKTVAGAVLRAENAEGGVIRIRSLGLPDFDDMASLAEMARAARENVSTVYEAQVIISPESVELLRKSTTLEVAPVETGTRGRGAAPASPARRGARP